MVMVSYILLRRSLTLKHVDDIS